MDKDEVFMSGLKIPCWYFQCETELLPSFVSPLINDKLNSFISQQLFEVVAAMKTCVFLLLKFLLVLCWEQVERTGDVSSLMVFLINI